MEYFFFILLITDGVLRNITLCHESSRIKIAREETLEKFPEDPDFLQLLFLNKLEEQGYQVVSTTYSEKLKIISMHEKYTIVFKVPKGTRLQSVLKYFENP